MKIYGYVGKTIEIEIPETVELIKVIKGQGEDEDYKTVMAQLEKITGITIQKDYEEEINKEYLYACFADKEGYFPIFEN